MSLVVLGPMIFILVEGDTSFSLSCRGHIIADCSTLCVNGAISIGVGFIGLGEGQSLR